MSCDFTQTQTSLSQNHQIQSPLQKSKVPAFFFGIVFSGQLVIASVSIQFHQGSHAFPHHSLKPEWSRRAVCHSMHTCACVLECMYIHTQLPWETHPPLSVWKSYCNMEEMQPGHIKAFKNTCSVFIVEVTDCCD